MKPVDGDMVVTIATAPHEDEENSEKPQEEVKPENQENTEQADSNE